MGNPAGFTNSTITGEEDQSLSDSTHGSYSLSGSTDGVHFIHNSTDSPYSQTTSTGGSSLKNYFPDSQNSVNRFPDGLYVIHNSTNRPYPQNKSTDSPYLLNNFSGDLFPSTLSTESHYPISNLTSDSHSHINFSDTLFSNATNLTTFDNDFNTSFREGWTSPTNSTEGSYSVAFEIIPPLIVAFGIIGNTLSLCVLSRKKFRKLSVSVYLRGLAVVDLSTLLVSDSFLYLLEKTAGNYVRDSQGWACKINIWLSLALPWISSWLLVCISVERVIVVYIPHKAKKLCTTNKAYMVTTFMYLLFLLGNIHAFFKNDIHAGHCVPLDEIYYVALGGVSIALYSIVPGLVIVICNMVIVCTLIKMSRVQKTMSHDKSASQNSKNLTVMLVMNCLFFLILTSPYNIISIVSYKVAVNENIIFAMYELANLNHAINFFLYVLCGSLFRKELFRMLTCAKTEPVSSGRSVPSAQSETEMTRV